MSANKIINSSTSYTIRTLNGGDSVTLDSDSVIVSGDLTVTGNAVLTGNIEADRIFSGTSNVEIPTPSGNVTIGVGGSSNIVVFSTAGINVAGIVEATGNITGSNVNTAGLITATGNITGGNVATAGNIIITSNSEVRQATIRFTDTDTEVFPTQVLGAVEWFTSDATAPRVTNAIRSVVSSESGNATLQLLTSSGGAANVWISVLASGNVGVANGSPLHSFSVGGNSYFSTTVVAVGNITGGNILTAGSSTATGNIQGGNLRTAGEMSATGNITGGNIISVGAISAGAGGILATGNIRGGNLLSDGIISATGNLTTTDIFASSISLSGNVLSNINTANNVTANNVAATRAVQLPVYADDTARDSAIAVPAAGMLIFNSTGTKFQGYTGAAWVDLN
jgi:filamentous hemagglutinin